MQITFINQSLEKIITYYKGVYVVGAKDPSKVRLLQFIQTLFIRAITNTKTPDFFDSIYIITLNYNNITALNVNYKFLVSRCTNGDFSVMITSYSRCFM